MGPARTAARADWRATVRARRRTTRTRLASTRRTPAPPAPPSDAAGRRADTPRRRVPARARCRPTERTARRRRAWPPRRSAAADGRGTRQVRASASSVAAASALPPPSPASIGMRFSSLTITSRTGPVRRSACQSAWAARQIRFVPSSGTPAVAHSIANGPSRGTHSIVSCSAID